jgi:hypothetical protein
VTGLAAQLHAVDRDYVAGEAAYHIRQYARDAADEALLLDVLGLTRASCEWDTARVAFVVLEQCRGRCEFTASTLQLWVPVRAWSLVARAITWLRRDGLIEQTGRNIRSSAPGARGRRIPCWQLTWDGERLSRDLSPMPGMIPVLTELNRAVA